ncbi:MAG: LLM class flavin-dependent oxidoreductase [Chloroflexota bacterium]
MPDLLAPRFGANIDPTLPDLDAPFARAAIADRAGLDLIAVQDHPYNRRMLETWTLLSMLAARTGRVHLVTNVANIPLRPPAMLAKQAATLDLLSGGRVELGIGAGAFWQGITAYGVPHRAPGEAYGAFKDALTIIRGMLDHAGGSFSYEGKFYRVEGARPGPGPAHRIPIWAGAVGPRMLRLAGRQADGVLVSNSYVPESRLPALNCSIDEGAAQAGRSPSEIRRGYNLMGAIVPEGSGVSPDKGLVGPVEHWIEAIVKLYREDRMDTFVFWPVAGDEQAQIEVFAREVVPAVRAALSGGV